jgi:predicted dinucleotide-binding enzyme
MPPKVTRVQMPEEGSAAQQAQAILGEDVKVVAAFQTISLSTYFLMKKLNVMFWWLAATKPRVKL